MPVVKATNFLKILFEKSLRAAFASVTTPKEYRYFPDENEMTVSWGDDASWGNDTFIQLSNDQLWGSTGVWGDTMYWGNNPEISAGTDHFWGDNVPASKLRIYRAFPRRMFNPPCIVVSATSGDARIRYLNKEAVKDVFRKDDETIRNNTLSLTPVMEIINDTIYAGTKAYTLGTDFTLDKATGKITWLILLPPVDAHTSYTTFNCSPGQHYITGKWVQSQIEVPIKLTVYGLSTTDRERVTDLVVLYVRHVFRDMLIPHVTYTNIKIGGESETTWDNQIVYTNSVTIDCWSEYANYIDLSTFELIKAINIQEILLES